MSLKSTPWSLCAGGLVLLGIVSACAVTGVGYDGEVGYVGGFYEPYGYDYGGWGGRYHVGPPRGGAGRDGGRAGGGGHAGGRGAPSIPSGARGGGGHAR
jgi:hypothetical protein